MTFIRYLPLVSFILLLGFLEIVFFWPNFIWLTIVALFLIIIFSLHFVTGGGSFKHKIFTPEFLSFVIPALFFILGLLLFVIFLQRSWASHLLVVAGLGLLTFFFKNIYNYFWQPPRYELNAQENLSGLLNLAAIFFWSANLYGLTIFLGFSFWPLVIFFLMISYLFVWQTFRINKIDWQKSWLYVLVISLLMLELFYLINFLPTSVYVNGILVAVVYYVLIGLGLCHLLGSLSRAIVKRHLIVAAAVILSTLLTTPWI